MVGTCNVWRSVKPTCILPFKHGQGNDAQGMIDRCPYQSVSLNRSICTLNKRNEIMCPKGTHGGVSIELLSINTLDRHLSRYSINIQIDTQSTLDWQLLSTGSQYLAECSPSDMHELKISQLPTACRCQWSAHQVSTKVLMEWDWVLIENIDQGFQLTLDCRYL